MTERRYENDNFRMNTEVLENILPEAKTKLAKSLIFLTVPEITSQSISVITVILLNNNKRYLKKERLTNATMTFMKKISLKDIQKEYESYDKKRERIIIQSRIVLKKAKELIYAIHRDHKSQAKTLIEALKKEFEKLNRIAKEHKSLLLEGSYLEATEEYAESILYFDFVYKDSIRTHKDLGIPDEQYLLALSDVTGELVRKATTLVIKGKSEEVIHIYDAISHIYKEMLTFNFRNGHLRKKTDAIRWNLTKIEDILYSIEIKK